MLLSSRIFWRRDILSRAVVLRRAYKKQMNFVTSNQSSSLLHFSLLCFDLVLLNASSQKNNWLPLVSADIINICFDNIDKARSVCTRLSSHYFSWIFANFIHGAYFTVGVFSD